MVGFPNSWGKQNKIETNNIKARYLNVLFLDLCFNHIKNQPTIQIIFTIIL